MLHLRVCVNLHGIDCVPKYNLLRGYVQIKIFLILRTKEEFDVQYSDFNITSDPKEIRFLDHKAQVVALTSYLKYDDCNFFLFQ